MMWKILFHFKAIILYNVLCGQFSAAAANYFNSSLDEGPVCGVDGETYSNASMASTIGQTTVMHCAPCGACSTKHDISLLWKTKDTLTNTVTNCAWIQTLFGTKAGSLCMRSSFGVDFTPECHQCWIENIDCTKSKCLWTCLLWQIFGIGDYDVNGLDPCLACDENECGPAFKECAGANRRRAGIESDIDRPDDQICTIYDPDFPDF